jgi:hypothetical protein
MFVEKKSPVHLQNPCLTPAMFLLFPWNCPAILLQLPTHLLLHGTQNEG